MYGVRLADSSIVLFLAVPDEIYPAVVTLGVTEIVFESFIPPLIALTEAEEPVILAGAVTEPLATLFVA